MNRWWGKLLAKLPGAQRWKPDFEAGHLRMRRRAPDGHIEYREPTDAEATDAAWWQATSL